jgi:hypothetical protein
MTDTALVSGGFDYGAFDAEVVDELREAAIHIRARGHEHASALVDIGTTLSRVKDKVGHGRWGSWLLIEFSMSVSTAERYMRVAKWAADKIVTVTNLQPSTLYILSAKSTPPSVVQEVLDRVEANDPISERELRRTLASTKKKRAEDATMPPHHPGGAPPAREEEPQLQGFEGEGLERESAKAAVLLLRESLGDDFHNFVKLWEDAGSAFTSALRDLAAAATGEMVEAAEPELTLDPGSQLQVDDAEQQPTASLELSSTVLQQPDEPELTTTAKFDELDERSASPDVPAAEPDGFDDGGLMAICESLKPNTKKRARWWIERGCPVGVDPDEAISMTERLAPFRAAARKATPEHRQRFFELSAVVASPWAA